MLVIGLRGCLSENLTRAAEKLPPSSPDERSQLFKLIGFLFIVVFHTCFHPLHGADSILQVLRYLAAVPFMSQCIGPSW